MEKKITWIDSLKGIAILGVIMIHSGGSGLPSLLGSIGSIGHKGVQLFFLLSAYLTYVSLEKFFLNREFSFHNIKRWWIKKFIRLVPLYYLALVIYAAMGGDSVWLGDTGRITFGNFISHVLFLHGFVPHYANSIMGIEWYIGVLAIFYFVAPYIYRIINSWEKSLTFFVVTSFVCSLISRYGYALFAESSDYQIYKGYIESFGIAAQIPVLILGILFFYITKMDIEKLKNKKMLSYALLFFAVAMLGGQAIAYNALIALNQTMMCSMWFLILAISQHMHGCVIIDNPLFRILGKYSWPIYLFHYKLIALYDDYAAIHVGNSVVDWGIKYLAIIVASLLISLLVSKFVDAPIVKMINRLIEKKEMAK